MSQNKKNNNSDPFRRDNRFSSLTPEQKKQLTVKIEEELRKLFDLEEKKAENSAFDIKNGRLLKYTGTDAYVKIPDGVKIIENYAFAENNNILSVVMPDTVTEQGIAVFSKCKNLERVKLSNSLTEISSFTFYNCVSLTNVAFPEKLASIRRLAFGECESLVSVVLPSSVSEIGGEAFLRCISLRDVELPISLKRLGDRAFGCCIALKNISWFSESTEIGCEVFGAGSQSINITYDGASDDFVKLVTSEKRKISPWETQSQVALHMPVSQSENKLFYESKNTFTIEVFCKKDKKSLFFQNKG